MSEYEEFLMGKAQTVGHDYPDKGNCVECGLLTERSAVVCLLSTGDVLADIKALGNAIVKGEWK